MNLQVKTLIINRQYLHFRLLLCTLLRLECRTKTVNMTLISSEGCVDTIYLSITHNAVCVKLSVDVDPIRKVSL